MLWYKIILAILLILGSVLMVVLVMMQKSNDNGVSGVIMGGSNNDTFFGKNKARSKEMRLQKYTKYLAIVFFVLAFITTLLLAFVRAGL